MLFKSSCKSIIFHRKKLKIRKKTKKMTVNSGLIHNHLLNGK